MRLLIFRKTGLYDITNLTESALDTFLLGFVHYHWVKFTAPEHSKPDTIYKNIKNI